MDWTKEVIANLGDDLTPFYNSPQWAKVRAEVLKLDGYECQHCKARGKYRRAEIVHHVAHLKDAPERALMIYNTDGTRQLVSLCRACHEQEHPERSIEKFRKKIEAADHFTTVERWD